MESGAPSYGDSGNSHQTWKDVHAFTCALLWGVLVPLIVHRESFIPDPIPRSAIVLKAAVYTFSCGAASIGIWLGTLSPGIVNQAHFGFALVLFVCTLVHLVGVKYRVGSVEVVGVLQIVFALSAVFSGFNFLKPKKALKLAYLIILGSVFVSFFGCYCFLHHAFQGQTFCTAWFRRRKRQEQQVTPQDIECPPVVAPATSSS